MEGATAGAAAGTAISPGLGTVIGAGLGLAGSLVSSIGSNRASKKQLEWQKYAQQKTWEREDNAVQRRAADLKSAGFNRLLAAGSSASSSAPVHVDAEQPVDYSKIGDPFIADAQVKMALAKQKADISQTEAQTRLLMGQLNGVIKQNDLLERQIDWYKKHPNFSPGVPSGIYSGTGAMQIGDQLWTQLGRAKDWVVRMLAEGKKQGTPWWSSTKK